MRPATPAVAHPAIRQRWRTPLGRMQRALMGGVEITDYSTIVSQAGKTFCWRLSGERERAMRASSSLCSGRSRPPD